jgi:hypothetical protein
VIRTSEIIGEGIAAIGTEIGVAHCFCSALAADAGFDTGCAHGFFPLWLRPFGQYHRMPQRWSVLTSNLVSGIKEMSGAVGSDLNTMVLLFLN